jgi:hypothetical protein
MALKDLIHSINSDPEFVLEVPSSAFDNTDLSTFVEPMFGVAALSITDTHDAKGTASTSGSYSIYTITKNPAPEKGTGQSTRLIWPLPRSTSFRKVARHKWDWPWNWT